LVTNELTTGVINVITTPLLSMSDTLPNAVVSTTYTCVSNTCWNMSISVALSPFAGAAVST